jgi:hypothetical protein
MAIANFVSRASLPQRATHTNSNSQIRRAALRVLPRGAQNLGCLGPRTNHLLQGRQRGTCTSRVSPVRCTRRLIPAQSGLLSAASIFPPTFSPSCIRLLHLPRSRAAPVPSGSGPLVHPGRSFSTSSPAMVASKIDGTAIAKGIRETLQREIAEKQKVNPRYRPSLKIIQGLSSPSTESHQSLHTIC